MKQDRKSASAVLRKIFETHRQKYRENMSAPYMCLMWSTDDPPDDITDTPPFNDIEEAFNISIDKDKGLELYDMNLKGALEVILNMVDRDQRPRQNSD